MPVRSRGGGDGSEEDVACAADYVVVAVQLIVSRHMEPPHQQATPVADMLLSLPVAQLDNILTRLDLHDIVRTSALSRGWRRRWESLPTLSLNLFLNGFRAPLANAAIVDSVLNRYAGIIPEFLIQVDVQSRGRVNDWLIDLSGRSVRSMDLRSSYYGLSIHPLIFTFSHVVTLKLDGCAIPPMPIGFAGFPVLKELKLIDVEVSENEDLEAIISRSPMLDDLELYEVFIPSDNYCVIEALNLRILTITSVGDYYWRIGNLPLLDNATFDLDTYAQEDDFGDFLAGVAHARDLTLSTFYQPYDGDTLLETLTYTFVNLRRLFLCTHFREMYAILSTFCLIRNAPNLEELEIVINYNEEQETEANAEFQNAQWTDGMCATLEIVKISYISCLPNEMCFIELVLSKAKALRTMSISLGNEFSMLKENVLSKVNTYRRASPHAQVFFKGISELND